MVNFKKTALFVTGMAFIPLGVVGLALPFLQGVFFLVIGVALLAISSRTIRVAVEGRTRRFPKIHRVIQKTIRWLERYVGD